MRFATLLPPCLLRQVRDDESGKVRLPSALGGSALTMFKVFARKIIRLWGSLTEREIHNERRAVAKLCAIERTHQNIVAVFDYGQLSTFLYFIDMELCDLNLDLWIYRTWDESTAQKLPFLTAELPPRARIGQVWDIMEDVT